MKKDYSEIDKIAIEMFTNGVSLTKISKELKVCRGDLAIRLKNKYNIKTNPGGRKYHCNDDVFQDIKSEEQAYWLGFLMADGCIRNKQNIVEILLAEKDKGHLDKFRLFTKSDYNIFKKNTKLNGNNFVSYRTYVVSKKMLNDLSKYGCIENKTYKLDTIPFFNDYNLDRSFIRGYFDGDGFVSINKDSSRLLKVGFTSYSNKTLLKIYEIASKYIGDLTITMHKRRKDSLGNYNMCFNVESSKKILFFMYDNSSVYLDRKYHLYKACAVHEGNFMDYEWAKSVKSCG